MALSDASGDVSGDMDPEARMLPDRTRTGYRAAGVSIESANFVQLAIANCDELPAVIWRASRTNS
jgi:hypothetical protein